MTDIVGRPPSHLFSLSYHWTKGSASASTRELYHLRTELISRIDDLHRLYAGGVTRMTVFELLPEDNLGGDGPLVWVQRQVKMTTPTSIEEVPDLPVPASS